jgi:hypothetical protein
VAPLSSHGPALPSTPGVANFVTLTQTLTLSLTPTLTLTLTLTLALTLALTLTLTLTLALTLTLTLALILSRSHQLCARGADRRGPWRAAEPKPEP